MFDYEKRRQPSESTPVIQAKRKVVHKEGPSIENAILWDNRQKSYFKNMRPRQNSLKYMYGRRMGNITGGFDEAGEHFDYMRQMYVDNSEKDRIGLNEVLLEFDENHFVEANKKNMQVYDGGERVAEQEEPFAIRLYAEGNMDHARGLSSGMEDYLQQAAGDSILPRDRMQGRRVLIKATEFRSLDEVAKAYGPSSEEELALYKDAFRTGLAQSKNLEGSFGGRTGDMTRPITQEAPRTYDLIQTTFFWLQGYQQAERDAEIQSIQQNISELKAQIQKLQKGIGKLSPQEQTQKQTQIAALLNRIADEERIRQNKHAEYYQAENKASYEMMIRFVRNQLKKLKPNGEIRIVVSDVAPYNEIRNHLTVASIASEDPNNPLYQNIQIEIPEPPEPPKTYPQQLADVGLNPHSFKQRQTKKLSTVTASRSKHPITKDLIIIIRKGDNHV